MNFNRVMNSKFNWFVKEVLGSLAVHGFFFGLMGFNWCEQLHNITTCEELAEMKSWVLWFDIWEYYLSNSHVNQIRWGIIDMFIDLNWEDKLFDYLQFAFCINCDCGFQLFRICFL